MDRDTAHHIAAAAAWIALALDGILESAAKSHIETIRRVTLGQMQTATEIVEADNAAALAAAPSGQPVRLKLICAPAVLARVKLYADNAHV